MTSKTPKKRPHPSSPSTSQPKTSPHGRSTSTTPTPHNSNHNNNARPNRLTPQHSHTRRLLPVYKHKSSILEKVMQNEVLLVMADTGSGKSTQIAAFLQEGGILSKSGVMVDIPGNRNNHKQIMLGKTICVTQPRRVAAITVGKRVAEEMGCFPGTLVGHRVRFDDCSDKNGPNTTRILYVTDGMLLREATSDPLLSRYGIVILDEAHERSLQTDILFGVVKRAMDARRTDTDTSTNNTKEEQEQEDQQKDNVIFAKMKTKAKRLNLSALKVVVMSATLDVDTFLNFFPNAETITIPGRQFPVQELYTKEPQDDYIDAALSTILQIHDGEEPGDILVFLPGQEEIEDLASLIKLHLVDEEETLSQTLSSNKQPQKDIVQSLRGMGTNINSGPNAAMVNGVLVCILYAALPPEVQMLAFQPKPEGCSRKIVLATNIAETSVTLQGIRFVVDSGKHKMREFSGSTGMERLRIANVSKAQATQRKGRAGRVESGYCFRLYAEEDYMGLDDTSTPEILRVNLSQIILQLKGMGIHDPRSFRFLTPPTSESLLKASELLYALGAIDEKMNLTNHGKKMAKLPLDPMFAHLLLQSPKYGCVSEMLSAVAMLSAENVFYRPSGNKEDGGSSGGSNLAAKAAAAHRRFASHEGDLPTMLSVYDAWRKEAIYIPPTAGGRKAQKKRLKALSNNTKGGGKGSAGKMLHGDWCMRNYISGRALVRAHDVRNQLAEICSRDDTKHGMGWDITLSCNSELEPFLKCACAGLFLQAASRVKNINESIRTKYRKGGEDVPSSTGRYKTKVGGQEVSIHPTSSMFGRTPAPKCVVYTELLVTKKNYVRGVTQVKESWLTDVAPHLFQDV